jgi:hypothetical protein
MLVAASVLPHPPLLLQQVSVSTPPWLADLRGAVAESARRLVGCNPDVVAVVGPAAARGEWDQEAGGTMRPYGVDVRAGGPEAVLPLSLTMAARVLDDAGWHGPRRYAALSSADAADDAAVGRRLSGSADRVAILAMGDGSAKRTPEAPGYFDERAAAFDATAVTALARGDAATLLGMSRTLAAELWVAGLPAWQALAGALEPGAVVDAATRYDAAPRGVGYFVVDWALQPPVD